MKTNDQQLLEEAYNSIQLNESIVADLFQWIGSVTGASPETLYTLYVKDVINFLLEAGFSLVLIAALAIGGLAVHLKLNLPEIKEKMRQTKIGRQVAELIDKYGTKPEIMEILEQLHALKGDRSKEATAKRKELAVRLKSKIEGTGVFDKGDEEAIDRGAKALRSNY